MGSVCIGLKIWVVGEGSSVLVPEFFLVSEVILELVFLCCCGGEDILVADATVSGGLRVTDEAAGVFGIGESSPNKNISLNNSCQLS